MAVAAVLLVAAGLAGWWVIDRPIPALGGRERVPLLRAPVRVDFDQLAVPHLSARVPDDLWAAVGYLHARERMWQMELYRRAAAGRLSELLGPTLLPYDRLFRRLGLRSAAEAELERTTPRVRRILERYADGVDAAVARMDRYGRPVEFLLLGIRPEAWDPADTLAIGKLMAWRLGENRMAELVRFALGARVSPAQVAELMGRLPDWAPSVVGGSATVSVGPPPSAPRRPASTPHLLGQPRLAVAGLGWLQGSRGHSNSWVLSGTRTASGRPMLANDPHLAVELPSIWYEAHLTSGALDVTGVTIPGVPFVVIGHNQRMGWGLTNVGADVQDFVIERIDEARRAYWDRDRWVPLDVESHMIPVRGSEPEPFEVWSTSRGPIAPAAEWRDPESAVESSESTWLSLQWDAIRQGDTAGALDGLGRAADWPAFLAAARQLGAPAQNVVYADVDGTIGYALAGAVPRKESHDGSVPLSAEAAAGARRFVPVDALPAVRNPPSGVIVTANNEVSPAGPFVTADWTAPFRAHRLHELLDAPGAVDLARVQAIQLDQHSPTLRLVRPALAAAWALARRDGEPAPVVDALARLNAWGGEVDGRPVVALYESFLRALWRRAFADELGEAAFEPYVRWASHERFAGLYSILEDPGSHWWDDVTTPPVEVREDIVRRATADAIQDLDRRLGGSLGPGSWSELHAVEFAHTLAAGGRLFRWFFSRGPFPSAGDGTTVNKTVLDWSGRTYATSDVASYRQILDVGEWDRSLGVITTGQSGHARSSHYFDQNQLWREGRYHTLPYSRRAVQQARSSTLLLVP